MHLMQMEEICPVADKTTGSSQQQWQVSKQKTGKSYKNASQGNRYNTKKQSAGPIKNRLKTL
jgi:hypothetical protein